MIMQRKAVIIPLHFTGTIWEEIIDVANNNDLFLLQYYS